MMKDRHSASRGSREEGYALSYELAREKLAAISDLEEQCRKSGARYIEPDRITLDYLSQSYSISFPDVDISLSEGPDSAGTEVPLTDKILLLHYLVQAEGTPTTGTMITFKQMPGGVSYYPAFFGRVIGPLVKHFGGQPDLLLKTAERLGGKEAQIGDASVTVNAFPHVPVTLALWKGDDEVAPSGNVLLDASISDYLPTEDVAVLCGNLVWKLVKSLPSA